MFVEHKILLMEHINNIYRTLNTFFVELKDIFVGSMSLDHEKLALEII